MSSLLNHCPTTSQVTGCFVVVQLWIHPTLLHLLPVPIIYCLVKSGLRNFAPSENLRDLWSRILDSLSEWIGARMDVVVPKPAWIIWNELGRLKKAVLRGWTLLQGHPDDIRLMTFRLLSLKRRRTIWASFYQGPKQIRRLLESYHKRHHSEKCCSLILCSPFIHRKNILRTRIWLSSDILLI